MGVRSNYDNRSSINDMNRRSVRIDVISIQKNELELFVA